MRRFTLITPNNIDAANLALLQKGNIMAAFVNALPPQTNTIHGTSVEFFFESGESISIDGAVVDVSPKEEAFCLRLGKAMGLTKWQTMCSESVTGDSVINTVDLYGLWKRQGLGPLLVGPRQVEFFRDSNKVAVHSKVDPTNTFDALRIHVDAPASQSLLFTASEDFPGDVVFDIRW